MDTLRIACVVLNGITIVVNVISVCYLVRVNRELDGIRARESARRREHFWRLSPPNLVDVNRQGR